MLSSAANSISSNELHVDAFFFLNDLPLSTITIILIMLVILSLLIIHTELYQKWKIQIKDYWSNFPEVKIL
jgi:membrane protein YdbS with pleckstrin-like domain